MRGDRLEAREVSHWFTPAAAVLDAVSLQAAAGEVVLLTGANGSGKTTLLRILAGVLRPRAGACHREGRLGYVPQRGDEPPPRISAGEWLGAVRRMRGRRDGADPVGLLEALGVGSPAIRLDEASRGTVGKVLLAAALADRPDILVLDEPLAALDTAGRASAGQLLRDAAAAGSAVVVSEHDHASPLTPTRTVQLSGGRLRPAGRLQAEADWRIVLADGTGSRQLVVPASERDRVLYEALGRGEQVLLVEPA